MIDDGRHRRGALVPERGSYREYSRTSSGWIISTNKQAMSDKRWRAVHPVYGEKFFAQHDDILKFTVENMRQEFLKTQR